MWKCSNRFGTGFTREGIKPMFKIQWVRDDAFGWPFSWGRSAQNRGGSPTRLFHLGFSDDCRLMWCRYDGISIWVSLYVEPSHAIFVALCLLADICHQLEHVTASSCWYLLHLTIFCQIISKSFFCNIWPTFADHDRSILGWVRTCQCKHMWDQPNSFTTWVCSKMRDASPTTNDLETELGLPKNLQSLIIAGMTAWK